MKRIAILTLLLLSLIGCGGGGIDFSVWAGTYTGNGTLDNSKTGVLHLTSASNGLVTGTLTATGADGSDKNFKFTAGTYSLNGSITSVGGDFEVTGNVPKNGDFFVRGNFPTDGSSKSYTIATGISTDFPTSQSYTGTLAKD